MRIALIWDADYPWDVRIEKVSKLLSRSGHDVHIIARNIARNSVQEEELEYATVHRLPIIFRFSVWLNSVLTFPAFFNPIWLFFINKIVKKNKIEYVLVRDLPLCPAAIWIAKYNNLPCSMDMAECYPELLRCIWKFEKPKPANVLVRNPYLADLVEKYCIKRLDKIFVMIEESRDRLINYGVPPERVVIVSNTPDIKISREESELLNDKSSITLLYLGILNPSRGLDVVIEGINELKNRGVICHLKIAGTGKAKSEYEEKVRKLGLDEEVTFLGWVDRKTIDSLFNDIDVGVVPHHVCSHWNTTIPNKLFDYMAAGIPVLSTDVRPMSRILERCGGGLIYKDYDVSSFADCVVKLMDRDVRIEMGKRGMQSIESTYNWSFDGQRLLNSI